VYSIQHDVNVVNSSQIQSTIEGEYNGLFPILTDPHFCQNMTGSVIYVLNVTCGEVGLSGQTCFGSVWYCCGDKNIRRHGETVSSAVGQ